MSNQKPSLPKGTRDFGPAQMVRRNYIFDTIRSVFKKFGYQPLETPSMENLSVLTGKYGDEGDQLLFKILNTGEFLKKTRATDYEAGESAMLSKIAEKGLRYDLTVPFARYVVMNRSDITFPFRRYQIQPVWRADRPQRGRYREFYQCDADVVGTDSLICEAEIMQMISEAFGKLGLKDYTVSLNSRKVLTGITEAIGAAGKEAEFCVAIDKLDKIGEEKVMDELRGRGFSEEAIEKARPVLNMDKGNDGRLAALEKMFAASEAGRKGLEEIRTIFSLMQAMNVSTERISFDPTLARGLSYYTGAIWEVKVNNVKMGSVSGGGRYDNLTGVFGMPDMSGVGFSFGVDRIYDVLEELDLFPLDVLESTRVLFINFDDKSTMAVLPLLTDLRNEGINCEVYPDAVKLKKQMNYADKKGIPYVVLAGSEEIASGKYTLKNMTTGEQVQLTPTEIISRMKAN
ncbi:histidine--tRNA ligase [Roseivirga sp. BDSF3-8]|uniref:histidine--tRNA ligase n=1 Tax=Roseivirga sp. BDSF3-8 TaxID=3241598 RepID=UPI003531A50C